MMERIAREKFVYKLVERFFILPGNHRLVTTGVIHVYDIPCWPGGVEHYFVVRGPICATTKLPGDNYTHKKSYSDECDCLSGTEQHDANTQKSEPDKWWKRKESNDGETGNPNQTPNDVKSIGGKGFYLRKQLTQRATKRDETESDHAKYKRQNVEVFCAPVLIGAWYIIDHVGCGDV